MRSYTCIYSSPLWLIVVGRDFGVIEDAFVGKRVILALHRGPVYGFVAHAKPLEALEVLCPSRLLYSVC
jgi:hypothetical protein